MASQSAAPRAARALTQSVAPSLATVAGGGSARTRRPTWPSIRTSESSGSAYDAFGRGDLDGALADLADDCVFHFGGEGPNSGDHKGRDAITAALIKNFELTAGTQALDIKGIYADDDHAAVVLHETASRPDGASIALDEVHVLRLRDGKVADLWDLPEDIQAHDDFFDGK